MLLSVFKNSGFSFGGMLACNVTAKLWRETYASVGLLKNVICISFGQPLIKIPSVQEAVQDFPGLEEMILTTRMTSFQACSITSD